MNDKYIIFIDGDGNPMAAIVFILFRMLFYGEVVKIIVYGKRGNGNFEKWCEVADEYDIKTIPLKRRAGRNAVDIKIAIHITKLICSNIMIKGFVIVASDYDFTPIVLEAYESGYDTIGFGGSHSPIDFQEACSKFFMLSKDKWESENCCQLNDKRVLTRRSQNLIQLLKKVFTKVANGEAVANKSKMISAIKKENVVVTLESNDFILWGKILNSIDMFEVERDEKGIEYVSMDEKKLK